MKKIVIIGANEFQNKLILKAKSLGFEAHVFAWKDGAVGEKNADFFYPVSITEKEQILKECEKINPCAVLSIASDLAMITVTYVAKNLGLICNDDECIKLTTNKYNMRKKLSQSGVYTPSFMKVSENNYQDKLNNIKEIFFNHNKSNTVIVKPTDRSGSRGITKVTDFSEITNALKDSFKDSFEKSAIIEEFIEGDEYSCECISFNGTHYFLTTTKKLTTGSPHFIETGHIQPSGLTKEQTSAVTAVVFKALTALNIQYGASHTEFKIDENNNVKIIEIGARMGGDCIGSDLVMLSTGYDFLKMVIDVSCNIKPGIKPVTVPKKTEIHFIFNENDLEVLEQLKNNFPEKIHFISSIDNIGSRTVVDSSTRFGYYILAY